MKKILSISFFILCIFLLAGCSDDTEVAKVSEERSVIIFSSSDLNDKKYTRIPTVAIANNGNVLAACEKRKYNNDAGEIDILFALSSDNGKNFTKTVLFPTDNETGRKMNPCFLIDRQGVEGVAGRIYCFVLAVKDIKKISYEVEKDESCTLYRYSDDNGMTWSDIYEIETPFPDECIIFGSSPSNGIQLENGTFVIPAFVTVLDKTYRSGIIYKKPGRDWRFSYIDMPMHNECTILPYGNGNQIFLNSRCETTPYTRHSYYSNEISLDTDEEIIWNSHSNFMMNTICQASLEVIPGNYPLYLFSHPQEHPRNRIGIYASSDLMTWDVVEELTTGFTAGYSVVSYYDDKLFAIYESNASVTECCLVNLTDLLYTLR